MWRVLKRLGIPSRPATDLNGLRTVYHAWCEHVPFDNILKMIALRSGNSDPLPGGSADEFFENWLGYGCGGTCWPTSNALSELLCWLGFDAWRITGSMRDLGYANHASVRVAVADRDWLVDSSALTEIPLPLAKEVFVSDGPVLPVEIEPSDGTHVLWTRTPPNSSYLPCRILGTADLAFYLARYEESRTRSPFNQRAYVRRNDSGRPVVLLGHTLFTGGRGGLKSTALSEKEVCCTLRDYFGISETLIRRWVQCGALRASFEEPCGEKPPSITEVPPSQRHLLTAVD
jgi:N-hydroxyarylamine O-acetyltransferase